MSPVTFDILQWLLEKLKFYMYIIKFHIFQIERTDLNLVYLILKDKTNW